MGRWPKFNACNTEQTRVQECPLSLKQHFESLLGYGCGWKKELKAGMTRHPALVCELPPRPLQTYGTRSGGLLGDGGHHRGGGGGHLMGAAARAETR